MKISRPVLSAGASLSSLTDGSSHSRSLNPVLHFKPKVHDYIIQFLGVNFPVEAQATQLTHQEIRRRAGIQIGAKSSFGYAHLQNRDKMGTPAFVQMLQHEADGWRHVRTTGSHRH